jgi:hypothetical protein
MTTRWEYLALIWWWTFTWNEATKSGSTQAGYHLWRPGTSEPENFDASTSWLDLVNGLGAEGWELVSAVVPSSIVGQEQGWPKASRPIRRHYIFKRVWLSWRDLLKPEGWAGKVPAMSRV